MPRKNPYAVKPVDVSPPKSGIGEYPRQRMFLRRRRNKKDSKFAEILARCLKEGEILLSSPLAHKAGGFSFTKKTPDGRIVEVTVHPQGDITEFTKR